MVEDEHWNSYGLHGGDSCSCGLFISTTRWYIYWSSCNDVVYYCDMFLDRRNWEMILPTDKITLIPIEYSCSNKIIVKGSQLHSVEVVSNGFTCKMTAEEFFKIIDEAHKW